MPSMQELELISEIQKKECLYNYKDSSYLNKEVVAKSWEDVAKATGLTAHDARERWKNIRSALVRNLKTQAEFPSKIKRPYYLIDYLQFVLPYVKPASISTRRQVTVADPLLDTTHDHDSSSDLSSRVKEEYISELDHFEDEDHHSETRSLSREKSPAGSPHHEPEEFSQQSDTATPQITVTRKRRHSKNVERSVDDPMDTKKIYAPQGSPSSASPTMSSMQHFLTSLLTEFDTMTEQQLRDFKIRTLMLIDEIKNSQTGRTYSGTYDPAPQVQR